MKIGFAGRVRASSQLSPAFETEASPNDASHSWPSPLQSEPPASVSPFPAISAATTLARATFISFLAPVAS